TGAQDLAIESIHDSNYSAHYRFMPLRPPRQARSRATWRRVLDAGVEILEGDGHEALTIANLCDRAAVTPPTIYARTPDKPTLLRAIHEHAVDRVQANVSLPPGTPPRQAVAAIAHAFLDNARLMRAIIRQASSEPDLFDRGSTEVIELG